MAILVEPNLLLEGKVGKMIWGQFKEVYEVAEGEDNTTRANRHDTSFGEEWDSN